MTDAEKIAMFRVLTGENDSTAVSDDTVTVVLENKEFFEKFLPAAGIAVNFVNVELVEEEKG